MSICCPSKPASLTFKFYSFYFRLQQAGDVLLSFLRQMKYLTVLHNDEHIGSYNDILVSVSGENQLVILCRLVLLSTL